MNSKSVGERTEAIILAELLKRNRVVLIPFGDNQRYDLVIEQDGCFHRIQCKTGRFRNGVIRFSTYSCNLRGRHKDYRGQIEYFGVYCPATSKCYLVPVEEVGISEGVLRIRSPRNCQEKKVRWAKDYEL